MKGVEGRRGDAVRGAAAAGGTTRVVGRAVAAVLAVVTLVLAGAAPAAADEQPSILKAYGLDWIERVRDDAWPQPKAQRPVICLLDTGVAVTPDTPADDPNGPIVARLAIDGGDGLPQGTTFEHLHGTTMASVIAAPRNNWGTVGVFPQARIVSVRVTVGDNAYIIPADIEAGASKCERWAATMHVGIAALVMAAANYDQRTADVVNWQLAAAVARAENATFVAALGNSEDAKSVAPGAVADIVSVGAANDAGGLCAFAPTSTVGVLGPGCSDQLDHGAAVWPAGSSAASAAVGALVAAIATRSPELPADARTASFVRQRPDGASVVDGSLAQGLFAGLVDAPKPIDSPAASPPAPATVVQTEPSRPEATTTPPARLLLWRPQLTATERGKRVQIRRADRAGAGKGTLVIDGVGPAPIRLPASGRKRWTLTVSRRVGHFEAWIEGADGAGWRSLTVRVRVSRR